MPYKIMKKILVIDDSLMNLKITRHSLQHAGYDVIEASNGLDGVKKAKQYLPILILMDIHMPDMDGVETLAMIRSMPELKDIPVVAITASGSDGDKERFIEKGFDQYISKPVNIKNLTQVVNSICAK